MVYNSEMQFTGQPAVKVWVDYPNCLNARIAMIRRDDFSLSIAINAQELDSLIDSLHAARRQLTDFPIRQGR